MTDLLKVIRSRRDRLTEGWNRFWFTPVDPTTLAAIRICTGLILLYVHLAATPELLHYVGPHAWVDGRAIQQIKDLGQDEPDTYRRFVDHWWGQSIWFQLQNPTVIWVVHALFVAAILCFTVGLFSRPANVLVWIGHLSYIQRGFLTWFGMDSVLVMLLFYLMFAPTSATWSIDRLRRGERRIAPTPPDWRANLVVRLIQVHMCIIYLCSGLAKLKGARWWDGTAVWLTSMLHEFALIDIGWLAHGGDTVCLLFSTAGVALTLFVEISFAYLIWNKKWRPVILFLAVLMHASIGFLMGMGSFQAVMLVGDLSFVAPAALRRVVGLASEQRPQPPAKRRAA